MKVSRNIRRLTSGFEGMDVGHELRVQLVRTNAELGIIDFKRVVQGEQESRWKAGTICRHYRQDCIHG
ncbi:MAG: hypothetical protein A2161_05935 [Candidatus Schekmanbacteria bacterium RBG_13_48_7]|uniref:Uncharacterized protein n=1 Tax=Candidatus Schekmanbacteria bacterium RBG_13_48_7 TaxID=1817878 RepID=A0A1F7RSM7_9BACT|nr:MAG: hypothetical protein A2161_05935 [Candidatus Schekmanbacteria bacterium RBG_13_48_7]